MEGGEGEEEGEEATTAMIKTEAVLGVVVAEGIEMDPTIGGGHCTDVSIYYDVSDLFILAQGLTGGWITTGPVTDYGTSVSKWMLKRRMNWRGQTRDFLRPAPAFVIDVSCDEMGLREKREPC